MQECLFLIYLNVLNWFYYWQHVLVVPRVLERHPLVWHAQRTSSWPAQPAQVSIVYIQVAVPGLGPERNRCVLFIGQFLSIAETNFFFLDKQQYKLTYLPTTYLACLKSQPSTAFICEKLENFLVFFGSFNFTIDFVVFQPAMVPAPLAHRPPPAARVPAPMST